MISNHINQSNWCDALFGFYKILNDSKSIAIKSGPLKLYDLLQMYEVHQAYQKVIAEDVMKNRPLNISEIKENYLIRNALRYLGGFTPEVIIKQSDIQYKKEELSRTEEIVRLIGKRCSKEHLKKVTIVFDSTDKNANDFRTEMPESMLAIESLTIQGANKRREVKCDEFLQAYKERKSFSITLKNMDSPEKLLKNLNIDELRELSIENCRLRCAEFWPEFFRKGIPSLESLTWIDAFACGTLSIDSVDIAKAFPSLKRLHLDMHHLKVTKLPNLKRLDLQNLDVFNAESLGFVTVLKDSISSIEEFSIIKPTRWSREDDKVKSLWSTVMRLAVNLRSVKMDCGPMVRLFIYLIEQIPHLTSIHLIGSSISQDHIKSFVKRADIRSITIEPAIYFSDHTLNLLEKYRREWHNDSPPINIYLRAKDLRYFRCHTGTGYIRILLLD